MSPMFLYKWTMVLLIHSSCMLPLLNTISLTSFPILPITIHIIVGNHLVLMLYFCLLSFLRYSLLLYYLIHWSALDFALNHQLYIVFKILIYLCSTFLLPWHFFSISCFPHYNVGKLTLLPLLSSELHLQIVICFVLDLCLSLRHYLLAYSSLCLL